VGELLVCEAKYSHHKSNHVFFPINRAVAVKADDKVALLATKICEATRRACDAIPASWIRTFDRLQTISTEMKLINESKKGSKGIQVPILEIEEVFTLARRCGVSDENEMQSMLSRFHQMGLMIYFKAEVGMESLGDHVILDPEWLFDSILRIFEAHVTKKLSQENPSIAQLVERFEKTGILQESVFDYLLSEEFQNCSIDYLSAKNHLLHVLEKCAIVFPCDSEIIMTAGKECSRTFLVPQMLSRKYQGDSLNTKPSNCMSLEISGPAPETMFASLLCKFFSKLRKFSIFLINQQKLSRRWVHLRGPGNNLEIDFEMTLDLKTSLKPKSSPSHCENTYLIKFQVRDRSQCNLILKWAEQFIKEIVQWPLRGTTYSIHLWHADGIDSLSAVREALWKKNAQATRLVDVHAHWIDKKASSTTDAVT